MTLEFDVDGHDDDHDHLQNDQEQNAVAIAFTITIIAGLATAIGGAIVFFPSFMTTREETITTTITNYSYLVV